MQFTNKLTEDELSEVRRMTRSKTYWPFRLLAMSVFLWAGSNDLSRYLRASNDNWNMVAIAFMAVAAIVLWALYRSRQQRANQLSQMNAMRPDRMTLSSDGLKCDGPNGATAMVPWSSFKGWREGRRVMLIERNEGNRFVILPVAQLLEVDRMPIRQFLQSHLSQVSH